MEKNQLSIEIKRYKERYEPPQETTFDCNNWLEASKHFLNVILEWFEVVKKNYNNDRTKIHKHIYGCRCVTQNLSQYKEHWYSINDRVCDQINIKVFGNPYHLQRIAMIWKKIMLDLSMPEYLDQNKIQQNVVLEILYLGNYNKKNIIEEIIKKEYSLDDFYAMAEMAIEYKKEFHEIAQMMEE